MKRLRWILLAVGLVVVLLVSLWFVFKEKPGPALDLVETSKEKQMFSFLYGDELLKQLECHLIPPQEVTLNPSVFRKEVRHENR